MHESQLTGVLTDLKIRYGGYLDLWLMNPFIAETALPGQFVMLKGHSGLAPILGRPFDIADTEPARGLFRVVVKIQGEGTKLLEYLEPGREIPVNGPLGKPVNIGGYDSIGLLVRGVGAAAVTFLAKKAFNDRRRVEVFLSANTAERLVCLDSLESWSTELHIATDDGSRGYHGNAVDLIDACLAGGGLDAVYTCGSKRFARYVDEADTAGRTRGFVFLEGYMACGVGNCHGCAVKKRKGEGYVLVCRDGPVFPVGEVVLE